MGGYLYPAGVSPAGRDPTVFLAPPPIVVTPRAVKFNPTTKQFVMNADGQLADVHPVDAAVARILCIEQGSVPSQPSLGTRLRALTNRVDPRQVPNIALNEVKRALQPYIDRGDVLLVSVTADVSTPGRTIFVVQYVNMRDPATNPTNPLPNATRVTF